MSGHICRQCLLRLRRRKADAQLQSPTHAQQAQRNASTLTTKQLLRIALRERDNAEGTLDAYSRGEQLAKRLWQVRHAAPTPTAVAERISQTQAHQIRAFIKRELSTSPVLDFRGSRDPFGLFRSLQDGTPLQTARILQHAQFDQEYLRSIPGATWTEILRSFSPRKWTEKSHRYERLFIAEEEVDDKGRSPDEINSMTAVKSALSQVLSVRRSAGIPLVLADYRVLLQHARLLESPNMARAMMDDMKRREIEPDLACWNSLLFTLFEGYDERLRWMRIHDRQPMRQNKDTDKALGRTGLINDLRPIFDEMLRQPSIRLDTASYCLYMRALARADDMDAVHTTLRNVWGLDIGALDEFLPDAMSKLDAARPNNTLFNTIADIFGMRDEVDTASRLIAAISDGFDMRIPASAWRTLLFWAWVHARRRQNDLRARRRRAKEARAEEEKSKFFQPAVVPEMETESPAEPLEELDKLYKELESEGGRRVALQMQALNIMFFNNLGRKLVGKEAFTAPLTESRPMLLQFQLEHRKAAHAANSLLARGNSSPFRSHERVTNAGAVPVLGSSALSRSVQDRARLQVHSNRKFLERWTRRAIQHRVPAAYIENADAEEQKRIVDWQLRGVPDLIKKSVALLPQHLKYQVPGGIVTLMAGKSIEDRRLAHILELEALEQRKDREREDSLSEGSGENMRGENMREEEDEDHYREDDLDKDDVEFLQDDDLDLDEEVALDDEEAAEDSAYEGEEVVVRRIPVNTA